MQLLQPRPLRGTISRIKSAYSVKAVHTAAFDNVYKILCTFKPGSLLAYCQNFLFASYRPSVAYMHSRVKDKTGKVILQIFKIRLFAYINRIKIYRLNIYSVIR